MTRLMTIAWCLGIVLTSFGSHALGQKGNYIGFVNTGSIEEPKKFESKCGWDGTIHYPEYYFDIDGFKHIEKFKDLGGLKDLWYQKGGYYCFSDPFSTC